MAAPVIVKGYYDTMEGQIHYRTVKAPVKDASKAPIMFMHMSASSSLIYEDLILLCAAAGYDCYSPDMPGFGVSYNPKHMPEGILYYVDVYMLLAKHAGFTKWHAFGHHSGASMATEMAAVYPENILSLTIVGPVSHDARRANLAQPSQPMMKLLGEVECPVLGMSSEKDILYEFFPRVKEIKPDATTVIVTGGDWEVMKDAEGCCKNLVEFLSKLSY
ncbi:alpha/beta-hydrolase [Stipitochalara longipes BDJ]|nr:alpha/beta-hydrolase [Stipitochalara longipes BDJ]